jgi:PAS domain S-box-containing protein
LKETVRALLIDDDRGDFVVTKALVEQIRHPIIELDWVPTFEEGLDAMARGGYDVYLVDYFLQNRTGLDLLREAARHQLSAPVIMLTGRGSHEVDLEAMQAGAADYLVKGQIEPEDVERSIRYALDRMEAQQALRASEERHRAMFDHLPLGVYRCGLGGEFLDANPALMRILGYPDTVTLETGYAPSFYVSAEDEEPFKARLKEFGIVRGFETHLQADDGRKILLRNTARVHRNVDGSVGYVEGIVEEVSRSGVHREASRYKALYECDHIGVLTLGRSGAIQDGNPAFRELSGYYAEDLSTVGYAELFEEGHERSVKDEIQQLVEGEVTGWKDVRNLRLNGGSVRSVSSLSILIRDWDGEPDHILVLLQATPIE